MPVTLGIASILLMALVANSLTLGGFHVSLIFIPVLAVFSTFIARGAMNLRNPAPLWMPLVLAFAVFLIFNERQHDSLDARSFALIFNDVVEWMWLPVLLRISRYTHVRDAFVYLSQMYSLYVIIIFAIIVLFTGSLFGARHIHGTLLQQATLFFNPNLLSTHALFALFLMMALHAGHVVALNKLKALVLVIIIALCLSRSNMLALVVLLLGYATIASRSFVRKIPIVLAGVTALVAVYMVLPQVSDRFDRFLSTVQSVFEGESEDGFSHRTRVALKQIEIIGDNLWSGVGYGNLKKVLWDYDFHNVVTQKLYLVHGKFFALGITGGLLAIFGVSLLLVYLIYYTIRYRAKPARGQARQKAHLVYLAYVPACLILLLANTVGELTIFQLQLGACAAFVFQSAKGRDEQLFEPRPSSAWVDK